MRHGAARSVETRPDPSGCAMACLHSSFRRLSASGQSRLARTLRDSCSPRAPLRCLGRAWPSRILAAMFAAGCPASPLFTFLPPPTVSRRCAGSAGASDPQAESGLVSFGAGLSPRIAPHAPSRARSFPRLPGRSALEPESDYHCLVSDFHPTHGVPPRGGTRSLVRKRVDTAPRPLTPETPAHQTLTGGTTMRELFQFGRPRDEL